MTSSVNAALAAFRSVDFDWAVRLQDVWRDPPCDVPELHGGVRSLFREKLETMSRADAAAGAGSPLGWIITGAGGTGKTHLLGAMRREACRRRVAFVLVDMTDVRDFWETVLQGYLDSLQEEFGGGCFQYQVLLQNFIAKAGPRMDPTKIVRKLAERKSTRLVADVRKVLEFLRARHRQQAMQHQDAVRALICLNSHDFGIASAGMAWLQAQEVDEDLRRELGFQRNQQDPRSIVKALSWFISLSGPTVVAFDQLDPIVHQVGRHKLGGDLEETAEQGAARAIIEQIAGGFAAMHHTTWNTLTVISCIESTWNLLNQLTLASNRDRFEEPIRLSVASERQVHRRLLESRLRPAYQRRGFDPPYDGWPFHPDAIASLSNETPREVLKRFEAHRKACLERGEVFELTGFGQDSVAPPESRNDASLRRLDADLNRLARQVEAEQFLDEKRDDELLAPLYQTALQCLIHEHEVRIPDSVDAIVEKDFAGGSTTKPLHARLRFVFHDQHSREQHYCIRAIERKHHGAYRTRLKAAMTLSGIDKALPFRRLVIVRSSDPPGGEATRKLTRQFLAAGGIFHQPAENELRTLAALRQMQAANEPDFAAWLRRRQPVTRLRLREVLAPASLLGQEAAACQSPAIAKEPAEREGNGQSSSPMRTASSQSGEPTPGETAHAKSTPGESAPAKSTPPKSTSPKPASPAAETDPNPGTATALETPSTADEADPCAPHELPGMPDREQIPLGRVLMGLDQVGEPVLLPTPLLSKHAIILGGSGSGKSVTLRRLIEEAALRGIPSIVIDRAQDMAAFDTAWDKPPAHWAEGDADLARRFHAASEMVVWTPGAESGNPISLSPLPDLHPLASDPDELEAAVQMVGGSLSEVVAPGNSQTSKYKKGVLAKSLRYLALHFPGADLPKYIDLLTELPDGAGSGVRQEKKLAGQMADSLRSELATNPLLRTAGPLLDPAVLFGDDGSRSGKTRISVVSFVGLKTDAAQRHFVNQLAMLLFSWIKQHPHPPAGRVLRGLLVMDEARDFVPSTRTTECKESLMRLAAQARKYRLGLLFATQHPKDIDTKIVGNCATHYYGLNNSPASLATLEDLMNQKGGSGKDIARLKTGQFYVHNADAGPRQPRKVKVPMSLSQSPPTPLDERQILAKARSSRSSQ